jgi:osmotically-inducible protein OsmY
MLVKGGDLRKDLHQGFKTLSTHQGGGIGMSITAKKAAYGRGTIRLQEWRSDKQANTNQQDNISRMDWKARQGRDEATRRLLENDCRELRALSCEFCDGIITLRGEVGSYYRKQLAQECIRFLPGVVAVVNLIEVHHNG